MFYASGIRILSSARQVVDKDRLAKKYEVPVQCLSIKEPVSAR